MTNFNDRFGGGAGSAFLGVPYPKKSTTLIDPYNTSYETGGGTLFPAWLGRTMSVVDTQYAGITLGIKPSTSTGVVMARGQRPDSTAVWSRTYATGGANLTGGAIGVQYYDTDNNNIYVLTNDTSTSASWIQLEKVTGLAGTVSTIWTSAGVQGFQTSSKPTLEPVTPATPDTSNWRIVYQLNTTGVTKVRIVNSSGTTVSDTDLKVDSGDTDQSFSFKSSYITADKTILMGVWFGMTGTNALVGSAIHIILQRGAVQETFLIPYDGNLPIPTIQRATAPGTPSDITAAADRVCQIVTTDSVMFMGDVRVSGTESFLAIYGNRCFDRVDFDRYLQALCNAKNMPAAEAFF